MPQGTCQGFGSYELCEPDAACWIWRQTGPGIPVCDACLGYLLELALRWKVNSFSVQPAEGAVL